jgi:Rrf2 family iron-sulfur cluster assembly transcriptional regulator
VCVAMFEIARGWPDRPITIKEISERQNVSVAYLEQILGKLRRAGIVRSVKGPGGAICLPDSLRRYRSRLFSMSSKGR